MTPTVCRVPLAVEARLSPDGRLTPIRVFCGEGTYEIDRVLAVRRHRPPGIACIAPLEYSVVISGIEKCLYYEAESGTWFSVRRAQP